MYSFIPETAENAEENHLECRSVRGVELGVDGPMFKRRPGVLVERDVPRSVVVHMKDDGVLVSFVEVAGCAAYTGFEGAELANETCSNAMDASFHIRVVDEIGTVYSYPSVQSRPRIHFIISLRSSRDASR